MMEPLPENETMLTRLCVFSLPVDPHVAAGESERPPAQRIRRESDSLSCFQQADLHVNFICLCFLMKNLKSSSLK